MNVSRALIGVGVAAWLPYLILLARGAHPSLLPYLALHLLFIFLGVRLKRDPGKARRTRTPLAVAGTVLVVLGVLVWLPYLYSKYVLHAARAIAPYLILHLSGVLTGGFLRLSASSPRKALRNPIPDSKEDTPHDRT